MKSTVFGFGLAAMSAFGFSASAEVLDTLDLTALSTFGLSDVSELPTGEASPLTLTDAVLGDVDVTLTSSTGLDLSLFAFGADGETFDTPLADEIDGVGIFDFIGSSDEITFPIEFLTVEFETPVIVTSVDVLDFFPVETALLTFSGGETVPVLAAGGNDAGFQSIDVGGITTTSIVLAFDTDGDDPIDGNPDFSLAAITVAPVPLPAAAWMLMAGLAGIGALSRRARKA